jgi:hypothetical protein
VNREVLCFIPGSDHLVEFGLSLLLFLVLLGAASVNRSLIAWSILGLASPVLLVAGFALLEQAWITPGPLDQQAGTVMLLQVSTLHQLLTPGLAGTSLASLLWLASAFPWRTRLALGGW